MTIQLQVLAGAWSKSPVAANIIVPEASVRYSFGFSFSFGFGVQFRGGQPLPTPNGGCLLDPRVVFAIDNVINVESRNAHRVVSTLR